MPISTFLASHIRPGDEIDFPLALDSAGAGTELYIHKTSTASRRQDVYQAPISYAAQPKPDKRDRLYVRAEVLRGQLGISSVHLPCEVLRDYFYVANRHQPWERQTTLYDTVRIAPVASLAELRLAFRLRQLELQAAGAPKVEHATLERAFNLLARPELRACYDALLSDPSAPVLFPYGGFGSLLVAGDRSRDGQTFFATRILSFLPARRHLRLRAPLRKFDFSSDRASYRDVRRKLEVLLDRSALPLFWDATWNQWKHLLGAKVEILADFVQSGKYRHRQGEWQLVQWETALPSRIAVTLPADITGQIETARRTFHRFGEFSAALDQIRARIERQPTEKEELRRLCWDLGLPGDFDVAQISWKPGYEDFFYRQLSRRTRRLYLFKAEYIYELERGVAAERPQVGHATYLFSKPASLEAFLALYTRTTKDEIRHNRANAAEKLGFLGRIVHGSSRRAWLREIKTKLGETTDYAEALASEEG